VLTADGAFVGIWRERAIAERIVNRSPSVKGERIAPMYFARPELGATTPAGARWCWGEPCGLRACPCPRARVKP
jgi:hypothetical protein